MSCESADNPRVPNSSRDDARRAARPTGRIRATTRSKAAKRPHAAQQKLIDMVRDADAVYGDGPAARSKPTYFATDHQASAATLMTVRQASEWASGHLGRAVAPSSISYLVQYGRIGKHGDRDTVLVDKNELAKYYGSYLGRRELTWKSRLGDDLNWHLSFDQLREVDTTKHVHRLHPYKGKFIPQLVEYFLDSRTDEFKTHTCFRPQDIVMDPFCGSGTTLVQANECGMHAIGIDVSAFNALISNVKVGDYRLTELYAVVRKTIEALGRSLDNSPVVAFERELLNHLAAFNDEFFPVPGYKRDVIEGRLDGDAYGAEMAQKFLPTYMSLVKKYGIDLSWTNGDGFLAKWCLKPVRQEIDLLLQIVNRAEDVSIRKALQVALSRTVRSCRATTHSDLATLKEPVTATYYCSKHGKVCKPLFSTLGWWERYSTDTVSRLAQFKRLRTATVQVCLTGDSRTMDITAALRKQSSSLADMVAAKRVRGIFSSPPYVGLIDYHEQHAYAYELFGFPRNDELEITPLFKGQGRAARDSYVVGISEVLRNCRQVLTTEFDVFLVANDKFNLYPVIAERAGLQIVKEYKRPVLNRTERDKAAYSESIFHLRRRATE